MLTSRFAIFRNQYFFTAYNRNFEHCLITVVKAITKTLLFVQSCTASIPSPRVLMSEEPAINYLNQVWVSTSPLFTSRMTQN